MNANGPRTRLAIVAPFYNEGSQVPDFLDRVGAALAGTDVDWSIVCVNDGSSDDTLAHLIAARKREPRVKVIDLSRNFGKEYALTAGLDHADADAVVLIDSDLQHPPEMLKAMIDKWREGAEVVYMVREERVDTSLLNRVGRWVFYLTFRVAADIHLPPQAGDFRLLDAAVVAAIRRLPERTRFMKGIFQWVGFRQVGLTYHEEARASGKSKSDPWRLIAFALDGISAFSNLPLQLWGLLGAVIAGISLVYGASRILRTFIYGVDVPGFESLIVAISFLGGVQLLSLGVLGGYVGRIFNEVKARPLYIVRHVYGLEEPDTSHSSGVPEEDSRARSLASRHTGGR
jgi:glycosyltransferase involved in cell wall biosynthesis